MWFQMLEDAKHAFLVVPPGLVTPNYQPDLSDADVDFLGLSRPEDAFIVSIVTLRKTGADPGIDSARLGNALRLTNEIRAKYAHAPLVN